MEHGVVRVTALIMGYPYCLQGCTGSSAAEEKETALETGSNFSIYVTLEEFLKLPEPSRLQHRMVNSDVEIA